MADSDSVANQIALAKVLPVIAKIHGDDSPYVDAVRYAQVRSLVERPRARLSLPARRYLK